MLLTDDDEAPTAADGPAWLRLVASPDPAPRLVNLLKLNLRSQGLEKLPEPLSVHCKQLDLLDVGTNPLTTLEGIQHLERLRILFCTGCKLGPELPAGGPLSQVGTLYMLSLAGNGLTVLDGAALPASLEWLIAKENDIATVRNAARLSRVRKFGLSHNQLTTEAVRGLVVEGGASLELLRVACNPLEGLPEELWTGSSSWCEETRPGLSPRDSIGWHPQAHAVLRTPGARSLLAAARKLGAASRACEPASPMRRHFGTAGSCPRLAWCGFAGSPYSQRLVEAALARIAAGDGVETLADGGEVEVGEELGRGSGAVVRDGTWRGQAVAVKVWHDLRSSDGNARDEWQMGQLTGGCADLVRALAAWEAPALGMAVELLRGAGAVGGPPNFDTCTRDTFTEGKHPRLSAAAAAHVAAAVCRACEWLHARGLIHGDVYLHNTLRVPPEDGGDGGDVRSPSPCPHLLHLHHHFHPPPSTFRRPRFASPISAPRVRTTARPRAPCRALDPGPSSSAPLIRSPPPAPLPRPSRRSATRHPPNPLPRHPPPSPPSRVAQRASRARRGALLRPSGARHAAVARARRHARRASDGRSARGARYRMRPARPRAGAHLRAGGREARRPPRRRQRIAYGRDGVSGIRGGTHGQCSRRSLANQT